ncbi:MAG: MFS transporter [Bacteroidetes bacterium]|nr:MFS transporter [Bacteroidota bacterium]
MLHATARTYRNAYSGISRETWLLSLIILINRSGTMVVPFMTLYLTQKMGYTVGEAGIVFGLFGAGAFSGAWLGGKLTDKIGFYPVQLITLTGGGILFIILGRSPFALVAAETCPTYPGSPRSSKTFTRFACLPG